MKKAVIFLLTSYATISATLFASQELFIFPVLFSQFIHSDRLSSSKGQEPIETEEFFAATADGEKINVRTTYKPGDKAENIAMIFHGNAETVAKGNFLPFFRKLGIPAFTFDYRGYGKSSGWPSEDGLYLDAEAVWSEIHKRSGIEANRLIILGNSIGSGPASYLAKQLSPQALILLAAYSDFPTLVSQMPLYSPFRFILRYNLPVYSYVKDLKTKCLILAHGEKDTVIPISHLEKIKSNFNNIGSLSILESKEAGHNDIFYKVEDKLSATIIDCLKNNPA